MNILNRKLRRDLWQTKGMLVAVILIVALGVGCLVGMMGTSLNLQVARDTYYGQCRMADFWVDLKKMPVTELDVLEDLKGISEMRALAADAGIGPAPLCWDQHRLGAGEIDSFARLASDLGADAA